MLGRVIIRRRLILLFITIGVLVAMWYVPEWRARHFASQSRWHESFGDR